MDTNHFLMNKVLNKQNAYYLNIIILVFIFYLIVEHMFHLTKMLYTYNAAIDYGTFLKKLCVKEYFEYETPRYQMATNEQDIRIRNSNNEGNYMTFILIITIFVGIFISLLFSYIVYNTFLNVPYILRVAQLDSNVCMKSDTHDAKGFFGIFGYILSHAGCTLYEVIIRPFYVLVYVFKRLFVNSDGGGTVWTNIAFLMFIILVYIVVAAVFVLMPIYIGLKVSERDDISPFSNRKMKILNEDVNIYVPYIILFSILVIMRFTYNVFYNYAETDVSKWHITEYLSDNIKNLYTTNSTTGFIAFFVFLAIYIVMFFIIGNVVNMYQKYTMQIHEDIKSASDKDDNMYVRQNIVSVFMNNVMGYKEYNQFEVPNVYLNKMSGITFVVFIILCVITAVSYICNSMGTNINVSNLLQYGIIVPLLLLLIVLFAVKNITEYNTVINKYIIEEPVKLYKQYVNSKHTLFNKLVANDYIDSNYASVYVCRNVGNGILLTLYSNLFKDIHTVSRNGIKSDDKYIDITPEFIFEQQCDNSRPFDYSNKELKEYTVEYYLNGKSNGKSIFYTFSNCSLVNMIAMETIGVNLTNMFTTEQLKSILSKIHEQFYGLQDSSIKTTQPMQYIKQEILMKSNDIKEHLKNFMDKLKKQIHESIYNITNSCVYNDFNKKYVYYNKDDDAFYQNNNTVDMNIYEIHNNNNKLTDDLKVAPNDHMVPTYNLIVNKVVEVYMDLIYYNLYIFAPLYVNVNNTNIGSTENFGAYQDDYIRLLSNNMTNIFNDINKHLSASYDNLKNDRLTKYVIANYNNVHTDKIYTKNALQAVSATNSDATINRNIDNDINVYFKYLKDLMKIHNNIKILIKDFQINQHKSALFVATMYDNKYNIETYIGNFESYAKSRNEQDIDIDKELFQKNLDQIFRHDNDQYLFVYTEFKTSKYTATSETKTIPKRMYDMTIAMMNLCKKTLDEINAKYNILISNNQQDSDSVLLTKYTDNIESYRSVLDRNINALNNDYLRYTNNSKLQSNTIASDNLSRDMSKNVYNDACTTDKLIYLVLINYVISIILANLIMI